MPEADPAPDVPPTWDTDRLRLRPLAPADAPRVRELAGHADIARTTLAIPHPYPEGAAEAWIATLPEQWRTRSGAVWAISLRAPDGGDGELIGAIGVTEVSAAHGVGEAGYWIGVSYWGRGYATEALRSVLARAFRLFGWQRIEANHLPENPASGRVMAKAGMHLEGRLRGRYRKDGHPVDVVLHARLESDPDGQA